MADSLQIRRKTLYNQSINLETYTVFPFGCSILLGHPSHTGFLLAPVVRMYDKAGYATLDSTERHLHRAVINLGYNDVLVE